MTAYWSAVKDMNEVSIMNCYRLKDDEYVCDEEDSDESDEDDYVSNDNLDMKNRLIVCFPCQYKFRVDISCNEVIDVWEGNESEVSARFLNGLAFKW